MRRLPRAAQACVYLVLVAMMGLPLTGLFRVFGSLIPGKAAAVRMTSFWLGSAFDVMGVVAIVAVIVAARAQLRATTGETEDPVHRAVIGWLVFAAITAVEWWVLVG